MTPGPPPNGTGICPTAVVEVQFEPLDCATDSITICPGDDPIVVIGTVALDAGTLAALETITVNQGTSPWVVSGTVDLGAATLAALETITVQQGTSPWVVSGTVELGAATLAALETITVVQGTSPWVVSGTVELGAVTLAALENITVQQGTSPWVVSGTVALDAGTLAALETITVLQGTSPWVVSANNLDIRDLTSATDSVTAVQGTSPWITSGVNTPADSLISTLNSSSTPLAANGAFIGTYEVILPFVEAGVVVVSDVVSATDGLRLEQSIDGINFADVDVYTIPANNGKQFTLALNTKFFRVTYTNGPTPQTRFELSTVYRRTGAKPSSHRINDTIITEDDAELVKSVLSGQITGGSFVNIGAESTGFLHTHDESDHVEDVPAVNGDWGIGALGVRNDTGAAKTTNDGDYSFFATDAAGRMGIADLGGSITIDGTVTANTNFDYPEDNPHVDGDVGAFVLAVRNDAGTPLAADGDYIPFTTDAAGSLRVTIAGGASVTQTGRDDTDDQAPVTTGLLTSVDRNYVWDPVGGNWDRWTGGVTVSGTVTVNQGTTPWIIGDGGGSITVDGTVTAQLSDISAALYAILENLQRPMYWDRANNGLRTISLGGTIDTIGAVTTVSTVNSDNVTAIGTINSQWALIDHEMRLDWQATVRNRIS